LFAPQKLRELRKNKKLTQRQLAAYAKVSQSLISLYETGNCVPSLRVLERFAVALKVPPQRFLVQHKPDKTKNP